MNFDEVSGLLLINFLKKYAQSNSEMSMVITCLSKKKIFNF